MIGPSTQLSSQGRVPIQSGPLSPSRQATSHAVSFTNGVKRKILTAGTLLLVIPDSMASHFVLPDLLKLWLSWLRTMWRKSGVLPPRTGVVSWPPG